MGIYIKFDSFFVVHVLFVSLLIFSSHIWHFRLYYKRWFGFSSTRWLKGIPCQKMLWLSLEEMTSGNLENIKNKSAYICGIMKSYRQKRMPGIVSDTNATGMNKAVGPDEESLKVNLYLIWLNSLIFSVYCRIYIYRIIQW